MLESRFALGIAPINWCNDDMPELGASTTLTQCFTEMRESGYTGTEIGHKYPQEAAALKASLQDHGLRLASCWHSTFYATAHDHAAEHAKLAARLEFLASLGVRCINIAECSYTIHSRRDQLLSAKPSLSSREWQALLSGLNAAGALCQRHGIKLAYHHHMGTVVQSQDEIVRLLEESDPDLVQLCLDTGHAVFAGVDPLWLLERYHARVAHVHLKDIRESVLRKHVHDISFLDAVLEGVFTVPGDGMLDYRDFIRQLAAFDYRGWLIVEAEQDPAQAHPLTYAKKAFNYLSPILGKAMS